MKIGDKVVCIKGHTEGHVKEGSTYTIKNIMLNPCCGTMVVDVGIKRDTTHCACTKCNFDYPNKGITWLYASRFVPIQHEFKAIEFTKVLEEEVVTCAT